MLSVATAFSAILIQDSRFTVTAFNLSAVVSPALNAANVLAYVSAISERVSMIGVVDASIRASRLRDAWLVLGKDAILTTRWSRLL